MIRRPALVSRPACAFAVAAVATLGLTGCAEMSLQATTLEYDPADGVSAEIGNVNLQDVMLITDAEGKGPAQLLGLATNAGGKAIDLTVGTAATGGEKFTVPGSAAVRFDGEPAGVSKETIEPITVKDVKAEPGETTTLAFTSPSAGQVTVQVPVLVDQHPYGEHEPEHATAEGGEEGGH